MRNLVDLKPELKGSSEAEFLVPNGRGNYLPASRWGDNAPSDRVTPRNFRKTRKPLKQPKPGAVGL